MSVTTISKSLGPARKADAMDDRKSEPSALASGPRGEEWLEDPAEILGPYSAARVLHGQTQVVARSQLGVLGREGGIALELVQANVQDAAVLPHGKPSVGTQVHDDLMDLPRVCQNPSSRLASIADRDGGWQAG